MRQSSSRKRGILFDGDMLDDSLKVKVVFQEPAAPVNAACFLIFNNPGGAELTVIM